jgi:ABC-2 type transport system permease protein
MRKLWFQFCLREWQRILRDYRIVTILLGGPFFYALIFGGVYWQGRTEHVPIVIVDQDHSYLSREITTALGASENLHVAGWINATDDFLPLVRREDAYACVVFPPRFEGDVLAGKKPNVGVVFDASNILVNGSTLIAIRSVVATYQVGLSRERLEAVGMSPSAARATAMPLEFATRQLFNPTSNYGYFVLMGLVCVALQSVTRIGCGIAITKDSVMQWSRSFPSRGIDYVEIFVSKALATMLLVLPIAAVALALPFVLFGAPFRGNVLVLLFALPLFVLIQISFGYGYAALCKSPVISTQLHLFMSVVLFTLSGFTWPYYAMPVWLRAVAWFTPLFHMNCLVRKLAIVGAPSYALFPHLLSLITLCAAGVSWGFWAVRKLINESPAAGILE